MPNQSVQPFRRTVLGRVSSGGWARRCAARGEGVLDEGSQACETGCVVTREYALGMLKHATPGQWASMDSGKVCVDVAGHHVCLATVHGPFPSADANLVACSKGLAETVVSLWDMYDKLSAQRDRLLQLVLDLQAAHAAQEADRASVEAAKAAGQKARVSSKMRERVEEAIDAIAKYAPEV